MCPLEIEHIKYHWLWTILVLGLSFRNTVKALSFLKIAKISHVSIWNWIQKYKLRKYLKNKSINEYIIDETAIKAGSDSSGFGLVWNQSIKKSCCGYIKRTKYVCCTERFLSQVVNRYGLHSVSSDWGTGTHKPVGF